MYELVWVQATGILSSDVCIFTNCISWESKNYFESQQKPHSVERQFEEKIGCEILRFTSAKRPNSPKGTHSNSDIAAVTSHKSETNAQRYVWHKSDNILANFSNMLSNNPTTSNQTIQLSSNAQMTISKRKQTSSPETQHSNGGQQQFYKKSRTLNVVGLFRNRYS